MLRSQALMLFGAQLLSLSAAQDSQSVLGQPSYTHHHIDKAIIAALQAHQDPVDAYLSLQPELAAELDEPRLLHVVGEEAAQWMTEGDKMRLRRRGLKFIDITDHEEFYQQNDFGALAGKAHLPEISHQRYVKPLFAQISTDRMRQALGKLSSHYTRYFGSVTGEESAQWIHDQVIDIVNDAPFHTHISVEFFTHPFPQPSIIARFEPKVRNFSQPLTIVGAHQDSMNYLFPLLPAPGADDDGSGSITILEAFRVLANNGFTPLDGPVEFHWYAAEEGGNLGSQAVARYKKESGTNIGAMMEFDATAFVASNASETFVLIETEADEALTKWSDHLATEYLSIPTKIRKLPPKSGSDYMSYTKMGYPAAFATEGDPTHGSLPFGDYNPYFHTVKDTMDVDDETGVFSFDHMAQYAKFAIAFVVEQGGWDNKWR